MAALVAGVQYGLSSHSNFHENKSLIFVKLTDSAQRAIEDFLRNRNTISQNPTIRFIGNEGQLTFPSTQSSHGSTGFTFSLSGNQDIEGPQGSFECIQQTGPKSLESLGALPCKMRIQANDDVYETTRHRMVVAEENNKNKCTRVLKPNEPIGRKVKLKSTGKKIPSPSNSKYRESTITSSGGQSRLSSAYKPAATNTPVARNQPEKKNSDLMRKPLRERLIHLLALRPYKKPELYDRITREGIKERDRNFITPTLKQIAFMRDNTYHLHRYVWNDVQEDWPYYTEQEKAMLKRRKPQNLTPPGSSDGSSGSGQSPNSTHPGSPPAITAPPPSLLGNKRPGYYEGNDGLPTKRPRISHYKKPDVISGSGSNTDKDGRTAVGGNNSSVSVVSGGSGGGNSTSGNVGLVDGGWDHQRQHQRDRRVDYRPERTANSDVLRGNGGYGNGKSCLTPNSDCEEMSQPSHREIGTSGSNAANNAGHNSHSVAHNNSLSSSRHHHAGRAMAATDVNARLDYVLRPIPSAASDDGSYNNSSNGMLADRRDRNDRGRASDRDRESRKRKSETAGNNSYNNLSSADYVNNVDAAEPASNCTVDATESPDSPKSSEYPDYLTYYTTISSAEQRRRYKAEFTADYETYRRLHAQVATVSKRFTQLQERLKQEEAAGNWDEYQEIKQQIFDEYDNTKRDPQHKETKRRFHYLHEKLSHIKRLVLEYDTQICGVMATSNSSSHDSNGMQELGILHY